MPQDITVKCAECGGTSTLTGTDERPLVWKCAATLTKGSRKGELCGERNILRPEPAKG